MGHVAYFNTGTSNTTRNVTHIGGAQIDSDLSDRALVQYQGGHS